MKPRVLALFVLIFIFLVWWQPLPFGTVEVTISEGARARDIAEYLARNSVVRDTDEFLFWLKISGKEKSLKSGAYVLSRYRNPLYVIHRLTRGGKSDIVVTIPEGLTVYETAEILHSKDLVQKDTFLALCANERFIERLGIPSSQLEGYLFPDTYAFSPMQSDSDIIMTIVRNTHKRIEDARVPRDSVHWVMILASLVEKEARVAEERPIIAKIFLNRLATHRPLESCATILYALKQQNYEKYRNKKRLLEGDLKFASPYNTYLHNGLPPSPICSPGAQSIDAVLHPADVDYLYFVAMGNGRHYFSKTFKEHIAAKERYSGTQ
jgi:UPF0755 protein